MTAEAANPAALPWRQWYTLQRWRRIAKHQLRIEPLCALCLKRGLVTPATIADHDPPHRGDWNAFRLGPLQSLCRDCHAGKSADDRLGYSCDIDEDGFPIDPRHPFNRGAVGSGPIRRPER
ncbi:MAG: HNH endonuclease [Roseiarcus sp.]